MQVLKEILLRGFESKDLDYKGPFQWNEKDKKACCEILKDILAMANTLGGYIVIGVSEKGNGFEWKGLTKEQAKSFETSRINRLLQNYADPPINTFLKKVGHNTKTFVIIEVPRFSDTPHICQKDYPSVLVSPALYVRTDSNESAPIRSSSDFRAIVERAVRNRSDHMLSSMRAILTGSSNRAYESDKEKFHEQFQKALERFDSFNSFPDKEYRGYREVSFHPLAYSGQRFSLNELNAAVKRAYANFRGWPFLYWNENKSEVSYTIQDGLETFVTIQDFAGYDRLYFWRLHQSGFFYHRDLMWEEGYARTRQVPLSIDISRMAMYVAESIYCMGQIYLGLIPDESEITIRFRVLGTEGIALDKLDSNLFFLRESCICRVPEIIHERCLPLAEWRAGTVDLALQICKEIFARFNWMKPDIESIREIIEKMLSRRVT